MACKLNSTYICAIPTSQSRTHLRNFPTNPIEQQNREHLLDLGISNYSLQIEPQ